MHPDPVVTVPELADLLDASDTHVRDNLKLLERAGAVESKDVGSRATAWWHESRVEARHVAPDEHPDQSALDETPAADDDQGDVWTVESAAAAVDVPGSGEKQEDRREAIDSLLRHLRDAGETRAGDLRDLTYEHHATHYESAESWWTNCGKEALGELRDLGAVELVDRSRGKWAWAGENA